MNSKKAILIVLLICLTGTFSFSQANTNALEETLHESGKIYIVVGILSIIFIGIIIYLIRTDLKIKKIEDKIGNT